MTHGGQVSNFTEPLILSPLANGNWRTEKELCYEIGYRDSNLKILVPVGFETDLGSVPGIFRWLISPGDGSCAAAFVLHDYLCVITNFSRVVTDAVLFEALTALNVKPWKKNLIFYGVSLYRIFNKD